MSHTRNQLHLQWVQEETEDMTPVQLMDFMDENDLSPEALAYCKELRKSRCNLCDGTGRIPRDAYDEDANEWVEDGYDECLCSL